MASSSLSSPPRTRLCVLGGGMVGATTALRLSEALDPAAVEISVLAARFSPDTTSDGAAGIWEPHLVRIFDQEGIPEAKVSSMLRQDKKKAKKVK